MELISKAEAKSLGLKHYFTGLACLRGHVSERFVSTKHCCACHTERNNSPAGKAAKSAYANSPAGKAYQAAYAKTPASKAAKSAYAKTPASKAAKSAYAKTPAGKAARAARNNSSEGKAYQAAYANSPAGKAAKSAYAKTPAGKAARAAYNNSPAGKAAQAAYNNSPERKAAKSAYANSPAGKAARAAYNNSPAGKAAQAAYAKENPAARAAIKAQRRAAKLQATPAWADRAAIKAIYEHAAFMTRVCNEPFHVDHFYPLQSDWVCGLHTEANLQILTRTENLRKSNKHVPSLIPCD